MRKMIGYFKAIDINTKKLVGLYKYSTVSDTAKVFLRNNKDHIKLFCCCNENNVEMKISSDLKIYPAKNETGELHEKSCPKYPDNKASLWSIEKTGKNICFIASPEANAKDYALKVNELTNNYIYKNNIEVDDYKEFHKNIYRTLKEIKKADGTILKNTYSALFKDISKATIDDEIFIYGIVRKVSTTNFSKELLYIDIEDIFENKMRFYIQKKIFAEMYNPSNAMYYRLLACGFAYKATEKSKIMTISDLYIGTINKSGVIF